MDDDFNTPEAMAMLFDLAREVNRLQLGSVLEVETEFSRQKQPDEIGGFETQSAYVVGEVLRAGPAGRYRGRSR